MFIDFCINIRVESKYLLKSFVSTHDEFESFCFSFVKDEKIGRRKELCHSKQVNECLSLKEHIQN